MNTSSSVTSYWIISIDNKKMSLKKYPIFILLLLAFGFESPALPGDCGGFGCQITITIDNSGTPTLVGSPSGWDDDVSVEVINNSSAVLNQLTIYGDPANQAFYDDGDGHYGSGPNGNSYETPTVNFDMKNGGNSGIIYFLNGLQPFGGSDYFSLESAYSALTILGVASPDVIINTPILLPDTLAIGLQTNVTPVFAGGTLVLDGTDISAFNFSVRYSSSIDTASFNGVMANPIADDASSSSPSSNVLSIFDSVGSGSLTLSALNTFTGSFNIQSSGKLLLSGDGSIQNSSGLNVDGIFDISGITATSTSVNVLSGSGSIILGQKTLVIAGSNENFHIYSCPTGSTNFGNYYCLDSNNHFVSYVTASPDGFNGVIIGAGGVEVVNNASVVLRGINTYIGATTIDFGSTLFIAGSGSIGSSNNIVDNGTLNFSSNTSTYNNVISGIGNVAALSGTTLTLGGANIYTGTTTVDATSTLALSGTGSIANSSAVNVDGIFDISQITARGTNIQALNDGTSRSGTGLVSIGDKVLTIDVSASSGSFSGSIQDGGIVANTGGSVVINGSGFTQTLSGTNTYTGSTTINTGATLALSSNGLVDGSIATSSAVNVSGTFDVSGIANNGGTSIKGLSDATAGQGGTVFLGSNTLSIGFDNGISGSFSGSIQDGGIVANTGGSVVINGSGFTQTLSGTNTYTGSTTINTGAALALVGSGSIAASTSVTNNGTFSIVGSTGSIALGGSYTQGSAGALAMNFSAINHQPLNILGTTIIDGALNLTANSGMYSRGKYVLLSSPIGITGTFSSFSTNLSNFTSRNYLLSYDSNDVYLNLLGPSQIDTQASLHNSAQRLRSAFNASAISTNFANMNAYDCNVFDTKGMCISAGGRYTTVDNPNSNSTSAVVVVGYKATPNIRIGGFLDQNVSNNTPTGIKISNKNPLMGVFAVWNQNADGLGYQVKVANAYQDKDVNTTRDVIGSSEAGTGAANLNTQSYVGELSYAFLTNQDKTTLRPYLALRQTTIKQDAYTETGVATPLTYAALKDRSTTALVGLKLNHALTPKATLTASLGIEQDLEHSVDQYSATSAGISGLTSENFNDSIKRTRPVASVGAYYAISKTQRISGDLYYQQLPFQSTGSTTAYFSYMIGI